MCVVDNAVIHMEQVYRTTRQSVEEIPPGCARATQQQAIDMNTGGRGKLIRVKLVR